MLQERNIVPELKRPMVDVVFSMDRYLPEMATQKKLTFIILLDGQNVPILIAFWDFTV